MKSQSHEAHLLSYCRLYSHQDCLLSIIPVIEMTVSLVTFYCALLDSKCALHELVGK